MTAMRTALPNFQLSLEPRPTSVVQEVQKGTHGQILRACRTAEVQRMNRGFDGDWRTEGMVEFLRQGRK